MEILAAAFFCLPNRDKLGRLLLRLSERFADDIIRTFFSLLWISTRYSHYTRLQASASGEGVNKTKRDDRFAINSLRSVYVFRAPYNNITDLIYTALLGKVKSVKDCVSLGNLSLRLKQFIGRYERIRHLLSSCSQSLNCQSA